MGAGRLFVNKSSLARRDEGGLAFYLSRIEILPKPSRQAQKKGGDEVERTKDAGRKSTIKMLLPSCTLFGLHVRFSWIPDKVEGGLIVRVDRFALCPGSLLSKRAMFLLHTLMQRKGQRVYLSLYRIQTRYLL